MKGEHVDLKKLYEKGDEFTVDHFAFQKSENNFVGNAEPVMYTPIGVDDSSSKGYSVEINESGQIQVFSFESSERVESSDKKWDLHFLKEVIKKYSELTGDTRS